MLARPHLNQHYILAAGVYPRSVQYYTKKEKPIDTNIALTYFKCVIDEKIPPKRIKTIFLT
jgi:hypothetical protein